MTTRLGDLDEFFDPGLELTVAGRPYRIDPPSAEVGLWCERVAMAAGGVREAKTEAEMKAAMARVEDVPDLGDHNMSLAQRVLGPTYAQLVDDDVDHHRVRFIGATAFIWIISGEDDASRYWQSGGRPEAPAPNRAARRATTSTAAASTTRSRGSTSGTKSRRTPSPARAKASRGKTS